MRRSFWFVIAAFCLPACQCVQLPTQLACTADACEPGESCGDDGRCHLLQGDAGVDAGVDGGVMDAGCIASTSCAVEGRQCGLIQTGCGEADCGACAPGSTCGTFQPGQCAPCDPAVFDFPDPNFVDSNCDGIDGTVDGGLFVDPAVGSDGVFATGARDAPLRSLAYAQTVISRSLTPVHTVFIAEGSLEGVTWRAPTSLAGGYRSISWARSALAVTTLHAPGVGLRLETLPASVSVSGLTIYGLSQAIAGTATVGLALVDSPVKLQTVLIRAQEGKAVGVTPVEGL